MIGGFHYVNGQFNVVAARGKVELMDSRVDFIQSIPIYPRIYNIKLKG
ncbi:hypothetical protein QFZ77_002913 [Paenibacillus sp. V4I3]|nr:hypothetical protein [Paenibacillus sp. V4I3]